MTASAWPLGPSRPRLGGTEVHVWLADLDAWDEAELVDGLAPAEHLRAAQILRPAARSYWIRSRGLLRVLLGRYLELGPADVQLVVARSGRPYVSAGPDFSLSHSSKIAVYALAGGAAVGVDVEARRPIATSAVARRLAATGAAVRADPTAAELLRHWTRREAAIKCAAPVAWTEQLNLGRPAVAALAASVRPGRLRLWTLDASRDTTPHSPPAKRRGRPSGAPI